MVPVASPRHDASRCAPPEPSCASPPAPRSAPWPYSASSPTARARRSARCWPSASRSPPCSSGRCCSCAATLLGGLRSLRGRDRAAGIALGAGGYATQAGLLLRRARPHRRVAALAARLHVPGDGRRGGGGARAASALDGCRVTALALASAGSRSWSPARGRARSTRSAPRSGSAPPSSTRRTSSSATGRRRARAAARARRAGVHGRGGDARGAAPRRSASCGRPT